MTQNHNTLTLRNVELENSLQSLGGKVAEIGNETAEIKESVASVKEEMAEIKAILAKHFEWFTVSTVSEREIKLNVISYFFNSV